MILTSDSIAVVREAIRNWIDLLSSASFEEAALQVNALDTSCSVEIWVEAIGRYSRKYREAPANEKSNLMPKITSPSKMILPGENLVIYVKEESTIVEYDLPIENSWSDLTAKFRLTEQKEGGPELSLIDIRVL